MTLAQSALIDRFRVLLSTRLHVPASHSRSKLGRILDERVAALRIASPDRYMAMLGLATDASSLEWDALTAALTVGESSFFRDEGLFAALRDQVLPELSRNRQGRLRVWSAGCSEGQELYSLAIVLHEMGVDVARCNLVGTDINRAAVDAAKRARYGAWSFRGVERPVMKRHFTAHGEEYELNAAVRQGVTFQQHDLVRGSYPDAGVGLAAFDLVLCRNVLIYFDPAVVESVVQRLVECVRPRGYLVLGNAEVHSRQLHGVTPRLIGGHILYQRVATGDPTLGVRRRPSSTPVTPRGGGRLGGGPTGRASDQPQPVPADADGWVAVARGHANQGEHGKARTACDAAMDADPSDASPHVVLAQVAEEVGEIGEAKERLRHAIYLDKDNAEAHLTLASLYDQEGEVRHASRAYRGALRAVEASADASEDTATFVKRRIEELNAGA